MQIQHEKTYISQGEHAISGHAHHVIATLLGSCVSACLWDPVEGVGGMNHVLFTDETKDASHQFGHGVNGMELLINELLQQGAQPGRLRAKVFGGAAMIAGLTDAGMRNSEFVVDFLAREGIAHVGGDLGGKLARRLEFWPGTGRARIKLVNQQVAVVPSTVPRVNEVEFF